MYQSVSQVKQFVVSTKPEPTKTKPPGKTKPEPVKAKPAAAPGPKGPPLPWPRRLPPAPRRRAFVPVDPYRQRLTVGRAPGAAKGEVLKIARVSQDDDRWPEKADLINGLAVKVRDTDGSPLDADLDVYLGDKRLAKLSDLPVDSIIYALDVSGVRHEIVIMDIYDAEETVTVGIRRR